MFPHGSFVSIVSALQVAHDLLCIVAEERLWEDEKGATDPRHEHVHAVLQKMGVLRMLISLRKTPDPGICADIDDVLKVFGIDDHMILHEVGRIKQIDPSYYGLNEEWFQMCLRVAERTLTARLRAGEPPTREEYSSAVRLRAIRTRAEDRLHRLQRVNHARISMKTPAQGTLRVMDHFET